MRTAAVNLVEIDLICRGTHVLDIPCSVLEDIPDWDYLANLVRRDSSGFEFYPITQQQRLPGIWIPLKTGDADAVLDLQDVFNRSYDIGSYPEHLRYTGDAPAPPLSPENARWADELLRNKGLR